MGCGMSTEEKEGKARNEEIENQLKKDRMMQRNEIKMLLLGKLSPRANCERPPSIPRPWVNASATHDRCENFYTFSRFLAMQLRVVIAKSNR